MTFPENDDEFEDNIITSVEPYGDDEYGVGFGSLHLVVKSTHIVPMIDDAMRTYGSFGRPIRGVFINGEEIFYRTPQQQEMHNQKQLEEMNKQERIDFEKSRVEMDAKFDALPDVYQRRILRYRKNNPNFRWKYEKYEVFCCEQAVVIADALKTENDIRKFWDLPFEEQKKLVPALDSGHSGNTFGKACFLAILSVTKPEYIPLDHAAIAPLVGCEEAGCVPVSREEIERARV
jgi:hypothetical protein